MERRKAIEKLSFSLAGVMVLPAWAKGWSTEKTNFTTFENQETLAALVDCIIPETETPGAKRIGAHQFVYRIIRDCYDIAANQILDHGLAKLKDLSFAQLNLEKRTELFTAFLESDESADKDFYEGIKALTIKAFTNSEYFLKNQRNYEMAPGYFKGSVAL